MAALGVGAKTLDGVQLGRVPGRDYPQPGLFGDQEALHVGAAMARQAVPDQDHRLATELAAELADEGDQTPWVS